MFAQLLLGVVNAAKDAPAGGTQQDPLGGMSTILFMLLPIFLLYWFFILRPQRQRQEAEAKALTSNLKKNDKVLTAAGIYGTVISSSETEDEVVVKVDDSTRLRMTKASILRNFTREEEAKEAKAAKTANDREQKQAKG
jgi:preprotein translocase subunit YajC